MRVLVFDTETTGLPKTKLLTPEVVSLWPHVVQLSYVMYDVSENAITNIRDFIVKIPQEIEITSESIALHGITKEISHENGEPIEEVLVRFIYDFSHADLIVGHNLTFDMNMLKIELMREIQQKSDEKDLFLAFLEELKTSRKYYCTMLSSINLCNLSAVNKKGNPYTKFPKLSELHEKLFQRNPKNLHNSLHDVLICLRCYYMLEYKKDLLRTNREMRYLFREMKL
jgi:DNA polymerase III epsilon subunit-like protein